MANKLELVGLSEIADMARVSKQAVANWRARAGDFPDPVSELRSGPVWALDDIRRWAEERGVSLRPPAAEEEPSGGRTKMAKSVAVINMKGGVGKSTVTANLGWYSAYYENKKVLLVDLDPQFNLSQYVLGTDGYEAHLSANRPTVVDIFEQGFLTGGRQREVKPDTAIAKIRKWNDGSLLHLVPSHLELAWTLKNPHDKEHLIRDFLDLVKHEYDLIIMDTAPTESMLTMAAYLASDFVLVPVRPEFLSTIGLPLLARSLDDFSLRHKKETPPEIAGILFNHASDKTEHERSRKFVRKIAAERGWYVFEHEIGFSDSYPAGARLGKPIFLTDYARSWKKAEFRAVAAEFVKRIKL